MCPEGNASRAFDRAVATCPGHVVVAGDERTLI